MKLYSLAFSLLLLALCMHSHVAAQHITLFMDVKIRGPQIIDFQLVDNVYPKGTIYADDIRSRSHGHVFVTGSAYDRLLCYSMFPLQIGPELSTYPNPHFDKDRAGHLACLARLADPKDPKYPFAIMYESGLILRLPYTECNEEGFINGAAVVSDGDNCYVIDHHGNIEAEGYEDIGPLSEAKRAVKKNGRWGFVDADFNVIVEPKYAEVGTFSDDVAWVRKSPGAQPLLIDCFGTEKPFRIPVGNIVRAYDYIDHKALVVTQNELFEFKEKLIDKMGNTCLWEDGLTQSIWATDFDNEHAEYFFALRDEEGDAESYCSTIGNKLSVTDLQRADAFMWKVSNCNKPGCFTAKRCIIDGDHESFYDENHKVWRCLNDSDDPWVYLDEIDGIAMWQYRGATYLSSPIRKSEKVVLGAEFRDIVRIAPAADNPNTVAPTLQSCGTAPTPSEWKAGGGKMKSAGK